MDERIMIGVCDDSTVSQQQVTLLINEYAKNKPELIQVLCFSSAEELKNDRTHLDLLFLDIELGESFGVDLVPTVRQQHPEIVIIFISSYHQKYFFYSHRLHVFQFLSKPFDQQIFFEELDRFYCKYRQKKAMYQIMSNGKTILEFPIYEIVYIEASLRHLLINHSKSGQHEKTGQISREEMALAPYGFIRCHSGYLVNARYIDEIKNQTVFLTNPANGESIKIPISKSRAAETKNAYQLWLLEQEG